MEEERVTFCIKHHMFHFFKKKKKIVRIEMILICIPIYVCVCVSLYRNVLAHFRNLPSFLCFLFYKVANCNTRQTP